MKKGTSHYLSGVTYKDGQLTIMGSADYCNHMQKQFKDMAERANQNLPDNRNMIAIERGSIVKVIHAGSFSRYKNVGWKKSTIDWRKLIILNKPE